MSLPGIAPWERGLFSLLIRKFVAYRTDFWVNFVGLVLVELTCAYFLWQAVFEARGVTSLQGYTLESFLFYYLLVAAVLGMLRGRDFGFAFREIYSGGFTRYILYPISVLRYYYIVSCVELAVGSVKLLLGIGVFCLVFGMPSGVAFGPASFLAGLSACVVAGVLYFFITSCVEYAAFWIENVWTLLVLKQFVEIFLGGALIPLSFFPDTLQTVLSFTPFPYLISFPVNAFMGQLSLWEWCSSALITLAWALTFAHLARLILRRGSYVYSGVGM